MINPFAEVDWNPDLAARRRFGRSLVIGFPIVAFIWLVIGRLASGGWYVDVALWLGGVGVAAGLLFALVPQIARPFYVAWYGVSCAIGLVVSNLILALSYYGVLVPIGLTRRLFGWRSLERTIERDTPSYWRPRKSAVDPSEYFRQF